MPSPVNNPQFQAFANHSVLSQPNTIQPGQGRQFISHEEMGVAETISTRSHMRDADIGFDPITGMRRNAQQRTAKASRREVMNVLLRGVRRSGSMARSISFQGLRGLGAVDCSAFNPASLTQDQRDAYTGLLLSVVARPDAFTHLAAAGAQCWFQHLQRVATEKLDVSPIAAEVAAGLVAAGTLAPDMASAPSVLALISTVTAAGGVTTAKRALQLAKCGAAITAAGGWAQYATAWSESGCMAKAWYENPLYLGGGAALIIGAVWFATRKKKAS